METHTQRHLIGAGVRFLEHVVLALVGLVLMIVGLGLTMTIVFTPLGIVALVGGGLLLVAGLFESFARGA